MTDRDQVLRASYHTLGCKLNFSETSEIGKMLAERNILRAVGMETPDICVVNTCSVTEMADKKGRQLIRSLHRRWPKAAILVTGCYAQLKADEVAQLPGVALVVGNGNKMDLPKLLDQWLETRSQNVAVGKGLGKYEFQGACERGDRTRWWLKVQDGCDYFCTYCTIPYARGRSRSGKIAELVEQACMVADAGGKEIVLTGVNVGCFGQDTGETFFELLRQLDAVEGIERYRISSIEPNLITTDIIDWIATESKRFMPHFHIPLQSGSDVVLKMMNRRYDTALFASRLQYIKERIPDAFIGVDVIAGARGESEDEWRKSVDFIKSVPFSRLHIFPYSERPGTAALLLGGEVDKHVRHERVDELQKISDRRLSEFMESFTGTVRRVLWEHPADDNPGIMHGHTDNYIRVTAPARPELFNKITLVKLLGSDPGQAESMRGDVIISGEVVR